jgi:hypothetical protein
LPDLKTDKAVKPQAAKLMELYVSSAIERKPSIHGQGMFAIHPVSRGEILNIDRILIGSIEKLSVLELLNPQFIKELYPRHGTIFEKLEKNVFGLPRGRLYLASTTCFYNHSCKPNAAKAVLYSTTPDGKKWCYFVVVALEELNIDTEIFINYHAELGHEMSSGNHVDIPSCECGIGKLRRLQTAHSNWTFARKIATNSMFVKNVIANDVIQGHDRTFYSVDS